MDRFFYFLLRTKSVLRLKNRSRTGKTDDFSGPGQSEKLEDQEVLIAPLSTKTTTWYLFWY